MSIRIISLSLLLVGCSPFPIHYACESPKFILTEKSKEVLFFDTNLYFEKSCPKEVHKQFKHVVNKDTNITIRVRGEWIDLKPVKNGGVFKLQGNGIRGIDLQGFTQAVRVDSLVGGNLTLTTPDEKLVDIKFSLVGCTCVTYDAI